MGFGPLLAVGSLTAGTAELDLVSGHCTAGFGGIKETSGVVVEGRVDGGWRAGISTDGGEVGAGSDGETWGRRSDVGLAVPCEPMLRAATNVVGMGCDSIAAFGVLAGGLGETFLIGPVKRFTSA